MADAPYKGLTIRFGADTSQFTTRLKAMKDIISGVQTQLRQMGNALKGDPQHVQALVAKFELLRNQTVNVASSMERMRLKLREMEAAGIDKVTHGFQNADQYVRACNEKVEMFDTELSSIYDRLKVVGKEIGVAFHKKQIEEWYVKVKESDKAVGDLGREIDTAVQRVRELKEAQKAAAAEHDLAKQVREYERLKTEIVKTEAELKGFVNEMLATRAALKSLSGEGKQLERLSTELRESREEGSSLHQQLSAVNQALKATGFKNVEMLHNAIELTSKEITNAYSQLKNMTSQLKILQSQTGIEKVTESMTKLKGDVTAATAKLKEQYSEIARIKGVMNGVQTVIDSYNVKLKEGATLTKEERRELDLAKTSLQTLSSYMDKLEADAREADKALSMAEAKAAQKKLQGEITETSAKMQNLTNRAKSFGAAAMNSVRDFATGLGATLGPALMMTGMYAMQAGEEIDAAFRDMKKTVDGTEEEFQKLRKAAVEFSKTHPVSADTILEIEAMGGQLGIAVDELEKFAEVVSNLDIATNMDAEQIAIDLGKLGNVMHLTTEDFERFSDTLVNLGNNYPALESDIMNITTRFAGMASIVGVLPDEILAIATAATATGQKSDAAGGSLQRTFGRIEGAVAGVSDAMRNLDEMTEEDIEAFESASGKLKEYADIAGMSVEQFASLWENTTQLEEGVSGTTSAFKKFIEGLKEIDESGGSVDATLQKLGITGVRDRQLLEGLTRTTDVLDSALKSANQSWGDVEKGISSSGDAAREAAQKSEGFSGKLAMLRNTAQTIGDSFTSKLLPVMDDLHKLFLMAADAVDGLTEAQAGTIAKFGVFTMALAPVLRMASQTAITFGSMTKGMGDAIVRMAGMASAAKQSGTSVKNLKAALDAADGTTMKFGTFVKALSKDIGANTKAYAENAKGANKLTASLKTMVAGMTAAKVAAAALAAAGIVVAVAAITNYIKKQQEFKQATEGLTSGLYAASSAAKNAAGSLDSVNYIKMAKDIDVLISKQTEFANELSKVSSETSVSVGMIEHWGEVVKANDGATEDNMASVARLQDAVNRLNDEYGAGLEVIAENGEYHVYNADGARLEADAIDELVEAKKREVRQAAINSQMAKIEERRIEIVQELSEAQKELAVAQEEYDAAVSRGDADIQSYQAALDTANKKVSAYEKSLSSMDDTQVNLQAQMQRVSEATDEQGNRVLELSEKYPLVAQQLDKVSVEAFPQFVAAMDEAGFTMEDLAKLTPQEIEGMTNAWEAGSSAWIDFVNKSKERISSDANTMSANVTASFKKMDNETVAEIAKMTGISESELWELAGEADSASAQAMVEWLDNVKSGEIPSSNAAASLRKAVTDQMAKAESGAKTAGYNTGAGFVNKLKSWLSDGYTVGYNIGANAVAGLNDGAGNASPSKKTRQSGVWFAQGFELGMAKEEDAIEKQATLLGNLAVGALNASSSASAGYLSARAASALGRGGATTNNNDNSTENVYITLNVEAKDLSDMRTIDDFVAMAKRAKAQYAAS